MIVTGGIDLSVGSLMGLSAVVFGLALARRRPADRPGGRARASPAAALGGALNALLITRLRLPPLIVTLGTFSLFRGLAEGLTGGVGNFTDFPAGFLFLGQGYLLGGVPAQLPAARRWPPSSSGCSCTAPPSAAALRAIGFSPEGARHAGIPVARRLAARLRRSPAPAPAWRRVIYVAHLGQAKADAGTGYELMAITAVVLGRHVDLRRPRHHRTARCSACSRSPCCRTACAWPTCRPSWPAS